MKMTAREYKEFMSNRDNIHNCENCPENKGFGKRDYDDRWPCLQYHYKRTHFFVYSWGIDELNDISIMSEEVMLDKGYTRFGTKEIPHTHKEAENDNK